MEGSMAMVRTAILPSETARLNFHLHIDLSYVADLVENTHSAALPNGSMLKNVALLDVPFGGITNDSNYITGIVAVSFFIQMKC